MTVITIRPSEAGEVPLSAEERRIAIRDGVTAIEQPTWHPALVKDFTLLSTRVHRVEVAA